MDGLYDGQRFRTIRARNGTRPNRCGIGDDVIKNDDLLRPSCRSGTRTPRRKHSPERDAFDECFQWYDLDENGQPVITLTQCGMCDMDTDPRGAECIENLRNPEMWRA